jgi:hypothetical protein
MGKSIQHKEAVGVFNNKQDLDKAIADLEAAMFPRHDISVIGSKAKMEERFGSESVPPELLEDNPRAPKEASIRPEEKTIASAVLIGVPAYIAGCLAGVLVNPASPVVLISAVTFGSVVGAAIGGCFWYGIKVYMDNRVQEQLDKGGLVLWVKTSEPEQEEKAKVIMKDHGARDVHFHAS